MTRCAALLLSMAAGVGAAGSGVAAADDLDAVMQTLAARRHGEVSFIEQNFISLVRRPIESSGELVYDAPDRLEKRTLEPRPETLLIAGDDITVQRGHTRRVLNLHSYPQIIPFIESVRATLAGDRAALERHFKLQFVGTLARWTLHMTPLSGQSADTVRKVQIDGARDVLFKVEITQADGDRSLMTLRAHPAP